MKFQLLPSTFDENRCASQRQHLACFIIDDCVSIDAGSLALGTDSTQLERIRDVVLTHAHLDHVSGLPLFIDDLFASLTEPIRVHASAEVAEILEQDIFNWRIYPKFSELKNSIGSVLEYCIFEIGKQFTVRHLNFRAVSVNHKVPSVGFVVGDDKTKIAITGDTAEMNEFWRVVNDEINLDALLIECAFPDELEIIAHDSHHLTPKTLRGELGKFRRENCPIYVINLKPMYREQTIEQLEALNIGNLEILEVGRIYEW